MAEYKIIVSIDTTERCNKNRTKPPILKALKQQNNVSTDLLRGKNIDPSINTDPDSNIYQHVANCPWLKVNIHNESILNTDGI